MQGSAPLCKRGRSAARRTAAAATPAKLGHVCAVKRARLATHCAASASRSPVVNAASVAAGWGPRSWHSHALNVCVARLLQCRRGTCSLSVFIPCKSQAQNGSYRCQRAGPGGTPVQQARRARKGSRVPCKSASTDSVLAQLRNSERGCVFCLPGHWGGCWLLSTSFSLAQGVEPGVRAARDGARLLLAGRRGEVQPGAGAADRAGEPGRRGARGGARRGDAVARRRVRIQPARRQRVGALGGAGPRAPARAAAAVRWSGLLAQRSVLLWCAVRGLVF
jgi:hypothetical protein